MRDLGKLIVDRLVPFHIQPPFIYLSHDFDLGIGIVGRDDKFLSAICVTYQYGNSVLGGFVEYGNLRIFHTLHIVRKRLALRYEY